MPNCVKCGQEISEEQYNNFKAMCPNCVRILSFKTSTDVGKYILGIMALASIILLIFMFFLE